MQKDLYKLVEKLIYRRRKAIQRNDLAKVDAIKRDLSKLNVKIEDRQDGTVWTLNLKTG